ncbi:MAG: VRR-NUC domain-containing protein, partial [Billgrantia desiderata]
MNSISPAEAVTAPLDDPFYYLANFRFVLDWVGKHHADLLTREERGLLAAFDVFPRASQALLVRMVMRKGELFRTGRLVYAEIGDTGCALAPLVEAGWVEADPVLTQGELFRLLRLAELRRALAGEIAAAGLAPGASKTAISEALSVQELQAKRLAEWWPQANDALDGERIVRLAVMPWCDRLRLMFFGNLRQDWAEFVLAELG